MEIEPLFAAEQIKVPPNLADVLKAFTKETIRQQPQDLLKFAAEYFEHMAATSQQATDFVPPTASQIRLAYSQLTPGHLMMAQQLMQLCLDLGIHQGTLDKVWQLGSFGRDSKLNPTEVLTLLLTMTTNSFAALVRALFDVFGEGGRLDTETLLNLLEALSKWDRNLTLAVRNSLQESLQGVQFLAFADLQKNPVLEDRLAASGAAH